MRISHSTATGDENLCGNPKFRPWCIPDVEPGSANLPVAALRAGYTYSDTTLKHKQRTRSR